MSTDLCLLSTVSFRGREITGPRLRGLLALLADDLKAGAGTQRLVDGLWPDDQPENPTKALQILVSRIRAQLGDGVIARTPTGYQLSLDETQVDAAAVLRHAAAAAQHVQRHDHPGALAEAEQGLALWDGPPKAEGSDPVGTLRAERAVTYRTLVRIRALALARLGRHTEANLAELAAEYPRDEEILLELVKAEAATQGPAAAMARYDTYRRALRDELGVDPGQPLRDVYQGLLQDEKPSVRHGVAHEPNPLLGRDDDLAAIVGLLAGTRVVSVVGPGGLGKTRLANAVARQAPQRTVHLVGLAGVATDGDVAAEVASALGATGPVASIAEALGAGALLVLDNCEHVLGPTADLVATLVATTRDLRVLTTSRAPLGLSSESVYPLGELDDATTEELFRQRARAARAGVDLPADAVAELCARLDGLPLAVELAAARVRVLSVAEINRRLADRFALLRGGRRDAPQRHHTLRAVVDWSWQLLDADGQAALRALSVFPGGFTEDAAAYLVEPDTVEHLVDQSLLKVADTPVGVRFRMLETVREFGAARLAESGDTEQVTAAFRRWVREFGAAHHDDVFGPDPTPAAALVRAEQDNLQLALRQGLADADGDTVAAAGAALVGLWTVDGSHIRAAATTTDIAQVLAHHPPAQALVEAARTVAALCVINAAAVQSTPFARMVFVLRRLPPAPPDTPVRAAAVALTTPGDLLHHKEPLVAAVAGLMVSYGSEYDDDLPAALGAARIALAGFGTDATPWLWILALSRLGELELRLERPAEAREHYDNALRLLAGLGDDRDVAGLSWGMMYANLQLGDLTAAERWLARATEIDSGTPEDLTGADSTAAMLALAARAELTLARGDVEAGLRLWRKASAIELAPGSTASLQPWVLEMQAGVLTAHALHDRLDLVPELVAALPDALARMLTSPMTTAPVYIAELPLAGSLLLAIGTVNLTNGHAAAGVRLMALAQRCQYLRGFQPTMSSDRVRAMAEKADRPAYLDAVSNYAGLDRSELRGAALVALTERAG